MSVNWRRYYSYEIIFVDDCGPGKSWSVIQNLSEHDKSVIGVRLSRNFGQHYAISAGLDYAKGDWCIVIVNNFRRFDSYSVNRKRFSSIR